MSKELEAQQQKQLEDEIALRSILNTKHGRRWLLKHLNDLGLLLNPFTGQRETTDYNSGRQSAAQDTLMEINRVSPGAFALMLNESQIKEESHERASSNDSNDSSNDSDDGSSYPDNNYDPLGDILRDI